MLDLVSRSKAEAVFMSDSLNAEHFPGSCTEVLVVLGVRRAVQQHAVNGRDQLEHSKYSSCDIFR